MMIGEGLKGMAIDDGRGKGGRKKLGLARGRAWVGGARPFVLHKIGLPASSGYTPRA
jgi:hypothetical protein